MDLTTVARDVLALLSAERVLLSDDLTQVEQTVRDAVMRIGGKAAELRLAEQPLGYEE